MSLSIPASSIKVTDVSTTPQTNLGYRLVVDSGTAGQGQRVYTYVQMTGGAATAGMVVARASATASYVVVAAPANAPTLSVVGVAQHAIPEDSYGFVLTEGIGEINASGAVVSLQTLDVSGSAGVAVVVTAAVDSAIACAIDAAAGPGPALITAKIACRG